jgi:hypothetical protein
MDAYVICQNDFPNAVVIGTEEEAIEITEEEAIEIKKRLEEDFRIKHENFYCAPNYWHIKKCPVLEG